MTPQVHSPHHSILDALRRGRGAATTFAAFCYHYTQVAALQVSVATLSAATISPDARPDL